jgi:hypothetical protein
MKINSQLRTEEKGIQMTYIFVVGSRPYVALITFIINHITQAIRKGNIVL